MAIPTSELNAEEEFILGEFCRLQREKHGPNWRQHFAKGAAEYPAPFVEALAAFDARLAAGGKCIAAAGSY